MSSPKLYVGTVGRTAFNATPSGGGTIPNDGKRRLCATVPPKASKPTKDEAFYYE